MKCGEEHQRSEKHISGAGCSFLFVHFSSFAVFAVVAVVVRAGFGTRQIIDKQSGHSMEVHSTFMTTPLKCFILF